MANSSPQFYLLLFLYGNPPRAPPAFLALIDVIVYVLVDQHVTSPSSGDQRFFVRWKDHPTIDDT